jgi:Family of unknown function (DUF6088)
MKPKFISVREKILSRIQQFLPGSILFVQDFAADGSGEAVRQELTRLVKAGLLKRLSQGIYTIPKRIGDRGYLLPSADEIASALARRDKSRIIPTGEVALWKLGLSTQVPLNYVYFTDGPSKAIKVEEKEAKTNYTITFKHASPKNFAFRGKISSQVIQALKVIGKKNLTEIPLDKIQSLVIRENLDDLNHDLTIAPVWISQLIKGSFKRYK